MTEAVGSVAAVAVGNGVVVVAAVVAWMQENDDDDDDDDADDWRPREPRLDDAMRFARADVAQECGLVSGSRVGDQMFSGSSGCCGEM